MKVSFKVRQDLTWWACDHGKFLTDDNPHEVDADEGFSAQIAAAEAQGSLVEVNWDGKAPANAVESDKDSMKKLDEAMESGVWLEGQLQQHELEVEVKNEEVDN